jgi:hypothetical protein
MVNMRQVIKEIIKNHDLNCSVDEFLNNKDNIQDRVDWHWISIYQELSEKFIDKFKDRVRWGCISKYQKLSEKFIDKFKDRVDWGWISANQQLSEKFIDKFKDQVYWDWISANQKLSEKFIEKFQDRVYWDYISAAQKLSEGFIEKFQDRVDWYYISKNQKLSEVFIEKFQDRVDWDYISENQKLSEKFIEKYQDKIDIDVYRVVHEKKSLTQKRKEVKEYAKKYGLKYDKESLYAFREHDMHGRGTFNKTISYKKGKYYKDWKCDMRKYNPNSFGLGIWPKGNTSVKVKISDWGVGDIDYNGKARVQGFQII